jgi:solute carrier family 25 oxoglutarate transporter 11
MALLIGKEQEQQQEQEKQCAVLKQGKTPSSSMAIPLPQRMVLAAFAGMGAATFCHPLDVIRVQMQTEGASYRNTADAAVQIYKNAGFRNGLYAGISAAYLRQWLYGSCRIGIYAYLLENAKIANENAGLDRDDITFAKKLSMGCISGGIGSFVGTPSELALVRMSADSKLPPTLQRGYKNVVDCVLRISREEGPTNLWRGATPTVARATLLSACQLGVTSEVKNKLTKSGYFGPNGEMFHGLPIMFCATLCSSFCANIVANPFDVVKSRMQNMAIAADGTAMYSGMMDCFVKSVKSEGPMVLYSGFTPAFVKLAPYTVISLTLADKLTKWVTGKDAL